MKNSLRRRGLSCAIIVSLLPYVSAFAQSGANPASLAFEEGRWRDVIVENERILEGFPEDRLARLRIAQAQRELGQYSIALETLNTALVKNGPLAAVDLERARNFIALDRIDEAMIALLDADHNALRSLRLLEDESDFDPIRHTSQFNEVLRNVRARVYPCEGVEEFKQFDFWLGTWEVRTPVGQLAGTNQITKAPGGCVINERWESASGGTGTSTNYYMPSRDQWRQLWVGSNGTLIDMTGGLVDGEMRMEGTIEYAERGRVVAFRATWSRNSDGSIVRQRMEEFDVASAGWELWFDGFYRRINAN